MAASTGTTRSNVVGLTLVGIGALFLLREFGAIPNISFWTLLWLAIGGFMLVGRITGARREWFIPLAIFGVGFLFLLRDLGAIRRGFSIWPIVVIALGVAMLLDARSGNDDGGASAWR